MKRFMLVVGLVGTFALTAVAASQAAVTVHDYNMPDSITIVNPCNGESVPMSGTRDMMIRMTTTGSGRVNVGAHVTLDLTGVGATTGAKYVAHAEENVTFNNETFTNGAVVESFLINQVIVAQGNAPNFYATDSGHITINANGEVTSSSFDNETRCQG